MRSNSQFSTLNSQFCVLFFIIFTIIIGCKNDSKPKCKYGTPTAIFSDTTPTVIKHLFQMKDETGVEMVVFKNKLLLEIEQTGCNEIHQQFSFIMFGKFNDADDNIWKQVAMTHFREISKLSPNLLPFAGWASAIESVKDKLKLSEPVDLEGGITLRIDKIISADKATLVVQVSQQ
jgi:hypothetical protein